ncbi:MAG TPA: cyclodeaminase/cyclohydrolase family protein, partial [bacterium]
ALCGALGSALVSMVGALTHGKKGYEAVFAEMETAGIQAQGYKDAFLKDVSRDSEAFERVMEARRLPKKTDAENPERDAALDRAQKEAALVPLEVMRRAKQASALAQQVAEKGNRNSLSDAAVAARAIYAAAEGAYFNVRINLPAINDRDFKQSVSAESETILKEVRSVTEKTLASVADAIDQMERNKGGKK